MIKDRKTAYKLLYTFCLTVICFVTLIGASVAWIVSSFEASGSTDFSGSAIAAYFAGGDGTEEDPYQIAEPVHLYNLAWLQYMGIFNADEDGDGNIDRQFSFIMNNDVDMNGLIIPPIGTEEQPFVGNFNGNGKIISGATVSNYLSETEGDKGVSEHPASVESFDNMIDGETASIVGFFGVVGDWNNTIGGLADDSNVEIVSQKANAVYDLFLDRLTVRTETSESLIGLLAGYVSGSIENVGIGSSAIETDVDVLALNITGLEMQAVVSRYSLIGEYDTDKVVWIGKPTPGGWGASVDMKTMFTWVNGTSRSNSVSSFSETVTTIEYDERNGERTETDRSTSSLDNYRYIDLGTAGSFTFYNPGTNYTYLCGSMPSVISNITSYTSRQAELIYVETGTNNTRNYLTAATDGESLTSVTTPTGRSGWTFSSDGYISTLVDGKTRYLSASEGTLALSKHEETVWVKDEAKGNIYYNDGETKYYLWYDGSEWIVKSNIGYKVSADGAYVNANSSADGFVMGNDADTATVWQFETNDPSSGSGSIFTYVDNAGIRYLSYDQQSSGGLFASYTYTVALNETAVDWTGNASGQIYASLRTGFFGSSNHYIVNNGGTLSISTSSSSSGFTYTPVADDDFASSYYALGFLADQTVEDTRVYTEYSSEVGPTTYFPLLTTTDQNGDLVVSNGNTGYIVGGSSYLLNGMPTGDIRVSRYDKSNIDNSLSSGALNNSKVRTISYAGKSFTVIGGDPRLHKLEKYEASANRFNSTLSTDNNYVYGLHFMDAQIDKNNLIEIDGAKILGAEGVTNEYNAYQLPRDAITFNIAEAGFVNFFAGTYYSGSNNASNTCFFSFHRIFRNESGTKITDIREISAIYGVIDAENGYVSKEIPYIYEYKNADGSTYFDDSLPSDYEKIFDTKWITDPADDISQNADYWQYVYYFEIPVNPGEYALGSVEGENGAYLMYLDLAANGEDSSAVDPSHTIAGVNFVDDSVLAAKVIAEDYPVATITLEHGAGVTSHSGVTLAFDRISAASLTYQLWGSGSGSFSVTHAEGEGLTVSSATVTVRSDGRLVPMSCPVRKKSSDYI